MQSKKLLLYSEEPDLHSYSPLCGDAFCHLRLGFPNSILYTSLIPAKRVCFIAINLITLESTNCGPPKCAVFFYVLPYIVQ